MARDRPPTSLDVEGRVGVEAVVGDQRGQLGAETASGAARTGRAEQALGDRVDGEDPEQRLVGQLQDTERRQGQRLVAAAGAVGGLRVGAGGLDAVGVDGGGVRHHGQRASAAARRGGADGADVVEDGGGAGALLDVAVGADRDGPRGHLLRAEPGQHDDLRGRDEPADRGSASIPSITGIARSSRTTSGRCSRTVSIPARPSPASATISKPPRVSASDSS